MHVFYFFATPVFPPTLQLFFYIFSPRPSFYPSLPTYTVFSFEGDDSKPASTYFSLLTFRLMTFRVNTLAEKEIWL